MDGSKERIEAGLRQLPPMTLQVVILVRYRGMGFVRAAAQLHIRRRTCIRLYCRAMEHMQKVAA